MRMIVDELTSIRNKMIYHSMLGEYKDYVATRKKFAKYCIQFPSASSVVKSVNLSQTVSGEAGLNTNLYMNGVILWKHFQE